jgi:hypothetical protein
MNTKTLVKIIVGAGIGIGVVGILATAAGSELYKFENTGDWRGNMRKRMKRSSFYDLDVDDLGFADRELDRITPMESGTVDALTDLVASLTDAGCRQMISLTETLDTIDPDHGYPEIIIWDHRREILACAFHAISHGHMEFERGIGGLINYLEA